MPGDRRPIKCLKSKYIAGAAIEKWVAHGRERPGFQPAATAHAALVAPAHVPGCIWRRYFTDLYRMWTRSVTDRSLNPLGICE